MNLTPSKLQQFLKRFTNLKIMNFWKIKKYVLNYVLFVSLHEVYASTKGQFENIPSDTHKL